jgi:iron complex transport system ATP-binding protein
MIRVKDISVSIGKKILLDRVSSEFQPGRMNMIIGPNGAGKSTLIKVLCKQLKPTTGHVFYGSSDLRSLSDGQLSLIRAVLSQNIDLAFPLSVSEVVMMGRYPHFLGKPGPHDFQATEEAMRFFDVWGMADRNYMTLSGGEKQRVHFARVLSQIWFPIPGQPRYLMLDEPLTFLDVHYQFQFMHQLVELLKDRELTVIGVVHDLNLAARFADVILLLNQGSVLAHGNREEVLTKENIKSAFQLEPVIQRNEKSGSYNLFFE